MSKARKPRPSKARAAAPTAVAHPPAGPPRDPAVEAALTAEAATRASRKAQRRGRAMQRAAFLAERAGTFDERALDDAMARRLAADADATTVERPAARKTTSRRAAAARMPLMANLFPTTDVQRWVPIGPSVVRRGQAEGRPRVTGRVRDVQVSADGKRAYAASAKGGVWYTDDAGGSWRPIGGWAERTARTGGNNNAKTCGCLLAHFGATPADDYVMVGTGELVPERPGAIAVRSVVRQGGVGVLAAAAPANAAVGDDVWEAEAGLAQLEGLGVFRLARSPGSTPGSATGAAADRVVAATSGGLFLGTRSHNDGPPPVDAWSWAAMPGLDAFVGGGAPAVVTDVLWLAGGASGRLVVAVRGSGVAVSDSLGAAGSWTWVTNLNAAGGLALRGRMSLAGPVGGTRVYVLGAVTSATAADTPTLWRIPAIMAAPPTATAIPGVPAALWGTQRDYDQAIAVLDAAGTDRVFLGGSTVQAIAPGGEWSASLWCFDVNATPTLVAAPGISQTGVPTGPGTPGAGADQPGLVGNNVHADVHAIRVVPSSDGSAIHAQVWVGCDGGVFCSANGGRVNSFAPRAVGLAALEVGYIASHPSSSHFVAIGCQDNGTQVRTGDSVWEATLVGDGGGLMFHPVASQYLVAQYTYAAWIGRPAAGFQDAVHRAAGGSYGADRESSASNFYSGPSAIASGAGARLAVGTNRVWVSDDLGTATPNTWGVIPVPNGALVDARPAGADAVPQQAVGTPPGLGAVVQLRWVSPTDLLAIYDGGLVRYVENAATHVWTATVLVPGAPGAPNPAANLLTDVCPVPGTSDFYLTTVGDVPAAPAAPADTCWFYEQATNTFHPTALRHALDQAGPPAVTGPLDPAYAVVVDPGAPTSVYVGTVTGVWRGTRTSPTAHTWVPFVNGLPQATVQDLSIWTDPAGAADAPRLLRAAIQSRGLWEVNLAVATEAQRTYVRVHAFDDRRRFPTPLANPQRAAGAAAEVAFASPDITVRPRANPAAAPAWPLAAAATMTAANAPPHQLWTFQTAFRWFFPSIAADGRWTDQFGDLVEWYRSLLGLPAGQVIDAALWTAVVGNMRLDAAGAISITPTDPLAVYRAPWQSAMALDALATEVDLMELVVPRRVVGDVWHVYQEPNTVEVLIHHRNTRPLPRNDAFAILLWQAAPTTAALLGANAAGIPAFAASLIGAAPAATPAGWTLATPAGGGSVFNLAAELDARLPRAVSIDVDLSAVPTGQHVLFLAIAGSMTDPMTTAPVGAPATVDALARAWPHAALRMVRVYPR